MSPTKRWGPFRWLRAGGAGGLGGLRWLAWVATCLVTWWRVAWLGCWPQSWMPEVEAFCPFLSEVLHVAFVLVHWGACSLISKPLVRSETSVRGFPGKEFWSSWEQYCWRRRSGWCILAPGCTCRPHPRPAESDPRRVVAPQWWSVGSADSDPARDLCHEARCLRLLPPWAL